MPAKYRLSGSEHSLRALGVRLLWLGARHGQAVLALEWTERDKLGRRQARCEAVPVPVETLLGLGMLEEVKR